MTTDEPATTFAEISTQLQFHPERVVERGFFPPLIKGIYHLLYALGRLSDSRAENTAFADREIVAALEHFQRILSVNEIASTAMRTKLQPFVDISLSLNREFPTWNKTQRITNLRRFSNILMQLLSDLDREIFGFASDPGENTI